MGKGIDAIKILVIINFIFFAVTYWIPERVNYMINLFALYFPKSDDFRYYQFLTHMFMHGGFIHFFLNMYGIWAFGSPLEQMWGKKKFLLFYFLCGIGAGLIYTLANYLQFQSVFNDLVHIGYSVEDISELLGVEPFNSELITKYSEEKLMQFYSIYRYPSLGASGAVYGILVAFGFSFPDSKLALIFFPFPIAAKYFIPIVVAIDLFSGLTGFSIFGAGIGHFAHVGGALIGFILMLIWRRHSKPPEEIEKANVV